MFAEAGRQIYLAGDVSMKSLEKTNYYMKAVEYYIRGGIYDMADSALKRVLISGRP